MDNLTQKYQFYKQFVSWVCDGCSITPLTDYINKELIDEDKYNGNASDERIYLDLRASSGYTNEAGKTERNESKINLGIVLKDVARKGYSLESGCIK